MSRGVKIVLIMLAAIALLTAGAVVAAYYTFPRAESPPNLKVEGTPAQLERGEYLISHVAVCLDCHSTRDWTVYGGPVVPGTEGKGGEVFPGSYGELVAPNITPAGIGDWSDGELHRAITGGVSPEGDPYFPLMPYLAYGAADPEDVKAMIAAVRALDPIEHTPPASELEFPVNLMVRFMPRPGEGGTRPDPSDEVAYGRYLATLAACSDCHTQREKGKPVPGKTLAGGVRFTLPDGRIVYSANITPDPETGIGKWSRAQFIERFKAFGPGQPARKVGPNEPQTLMPWFNYAGMTEQDLGAIYAWLRSTTPVKNQVDVFPGH